MTSKLAICNSHSWMIGDYFLEAAAEKTGNKFWTANYILAWFTALFIYISFDSMIPVLPLYIEIWEGISGGTGLPFASLALGALLIRPFAGWAVDNYRRRNLFWLWLLLFLLPVLIYILMVSAYLLIGLRFLQGIGFGVSTTALFTVASDIMPRNRFGEGMGYFTAAMSLTPASWQLHLWSWGLFRVSFSIKKGSGLQYCGDYWGGCFYRFFNYSCPDEFFDRSGHRRIVLWYRLCFYSADHDFSDRKKCFTG